MHATTQEPSRFFPGSLGECLDDLAQMKLRLEGVIRTPERDLLIDTIDQFVARVYALEGVALNAASIRMAIHEALHLATMADHFVSGVLPLYLIRDAVTRGQEQIVYLT